jgi:hypothetical protein
MRSNQSSDNEPRVRSRAGTRQRRLGLTLLVGGLIVLVAAFIPSSASAQTTTSSSSSSDLGASFIPEGHAHVTFTCEGADDATKALLANPLVNLSTFPITGDITSFPFTSPNNGDPFTTQFAWTFTQSADLVGISVGLGVTDFTLTNGVDTMSAVSGATGSSVGHPPTQNVPLGDGTAAVSYNQGPFSGNFTRTGAIGTPIVFKPTDITVTVTPNPLTTNLNLVCHPDSAQISLTDQAGATPPPPSITTPPTVPPATGAPATTAAGPTVEATSSLARTGFHAELLYIGIAMLGFGYALSLTGRRFAKQSSRSD